MQNRVFCSHSLLPFSLSVKLEKIRFVMKCKCDIWYFSCMQVFARFHIVTLSHVHFQWPKISLYFGIFRCRILIKNYLEHFWEKKKVEIKRKKEFTYQACLLLEIKEPLLLQHERRDFSDSTVKMWILILFR